MVETHKFHYEVRVPEIVDTASHRPQKNALLRQCKRLFRFSLVGTLNTVLDLLVLNGLLLLFPTSRIWLIMTYNIVAYGCGACNSFVMNKYWTFKLRHRASWSELLRFAITMLLGMSVNTGLIWLASMLPHTFVRSMVIWTNISKIAALAISSLASYLGMGLWVFVKTGKRESEKNVYHKIARTDENARSLLLTAQTDDTHTAQLQGSKPVTHHSLSVVLPAFNEEQIIAETLHDILMQLASWEIDFEIIVVNDGSKDRTASIVSEIARSYPQVRLLNHTTNRGYGAALVSGFAAASRGLIFFMDSDGQFAIAELRQFFSCIDSYDAVIGYRINRRDTWMRKLNAWGWKLLVGLVLGVHVRDIDCAFKLLHTDFLRQVPLETSGAMVNAELLYKLRRSGRTCKEIGVHHFPRLSGRATGAKLSVILRALRELFIYACKWHHEQYQLPDQEVR